MKISTYVAGLPEAPPTGTAVPVPVVAVPVDAIPFDVAVAETGPRFCRTCGATWDPAWSACEPCGRQVRRATVLGEHAPEQRAMTSAIAVYFSLLAVCAAGLVAGLCGAGRHDGGLGIQLFVTAGLSLVTLAWATADRRAVLPALATVPGPGWFAAAVGMSLVTVAIGTGTITGFQRFVHQSGQPMSRPFLDAGYGWGFVVLCTCVQPAVIEELAFRGVIFAGVGRALSRFETVLVTALMFMILHLSPVRFPHTLALGLAAGYLRTRTGSLYPCMALHFAHNLLVVGGERFHWF